VRAKSDSALGVTLATGTDGGKAPELDVYFDATAR